MLVFPLRFLIKGTMIEKELMINDWVMLDGKEPKQITGIYAHHCKHGYVQIKNLDCSAEYLSPIPITKEILESNGFKVREGCTTAWDWHSGETSVHIDGDHRCPIGQTLTIYVPGGTVGAAFSSHRAISDLKIGGIHELQHALRLCHVNKEIEIKWTRNNTED